MPTEPAKITATTSEEQLPDDVAALKQMVLTLLGQIDDLNGQLYYLKRQLFGRKSEKLNAAQRMLFQDLYDQVQSKLDAQEEPDKQPPARRKRRANSNHQGRRPLPKDLPREEMESLWRTVKKEG